MNRIAYSLEARKYDPFDTHLAVHIEINTQNGLLTSVISTAALIGNFHRPGTLTHQASEKYGGTLRFRGSQPVLFFASSSSGDAARQLIEAAAAPRYRHAANHHRSGGNA
jgi:hypothetical protein